MTVDSGASLSSQPAAAGAEAGVPAGTLARAWQALWHRGRAAPGEAPRRRGINGVTLAALTLIAIQLFWLLALLTRSYFRQDDYFNFDRALAEGFTWKYLMLVSAGHMAPFAFAMSWVLAKVSLYSWPLTSLVILAFVVACCLALLRVLRTLFGNRPAILIPLVVYLFSPLALAALDWWTVAAQTLPLELSIFMAVDAHVRYLRSGRMRQAVAAACWTLLGMATVEKGALIPLLLFGFTSAFFTEGHWPAAMVRAARRYWRAWLLYGVLLAGYCVLFFIRLPSSTSPPGYRGPFSQIVSFAATLLGTTLLPGVVGGPWRWTTLGDGYAQASAPVALQQLSWAVALLVVVASCVYRAHAWRAWAILAGWIAAADMLPVIVGRLAAIPAALLGLQARYVTDVATVLALCLGFAFLPLAGQPGGAPSRVSAAAEVAAAPPADRAAAQTAAQWARGASRLVLAAFLVGSFWSLQALEGITNSAAARSYIATARAAVAKAPRGTLIVDTPTPTMIMNPIFFNPYGNTSYVIGALARAHPARHLSWIRSPQGVVRHPMIFDTNGQLRPAAVGGVPSMPLPHGQRCWSMTPVRTRIPLQRPLFPWGWTVKLDYSGPATALTVGLGGTSAAVTLPAGRHSVYVPLAGKGSAVTLGLLGPWPGGCLAGVTVGTWQPALTGQAIPAAPVPG